MNKKAVPYCPGCGARRGREIESGRYVCSKCGAVYEKEDSFVLDTRPHVHLEKAERQAKRRGKR